MTTTRQTTAHTAWNVYLLGKLIDTVFYSGQVDAEEVRRSLIDHDGYDARIVVRRYRRLL